MAPTTTSQGTGRPDLIVLFIFSLVLMGLGVTGFVTAALQVAEQASTATLRSNLETPTPFALSPEQVTPAPAPDLTLGPDTLAAPAVGLRIPLVSLGLDGEGNFAIPDPDKASLFTDGAPLDALVGSSFIAGHVVDKAGRYAPMAQLANLTPGDRVLTTDTAGTRRDWIVTGKQIVSRNGLDASMWATTGPRELILVTCAGRIDQSVGAVTQFTENLVITAVPAA